MFYIQGILREMARTHPKLKLQALFRSNLIGVYGRDLRAFYNGGSSKEHMKKLKRHVLNYEHDFSSSHLFLDLIRLLMFILISPSIAMTVEPE